MWGGAPEFCEQTVLPCAQPFPSPSRHVGALLRLPPCSDHVSATWTGRQADRLRNTLLVSGVSWVIRYCRRDPATLADKGFSRWLTGKEAICQCRRCRGLGFDPWVGKISWESKRQPAPAFLPGKPHGQRSQAGYSRSLGSQRVGHD